MRHLVGEATPELEHLRADAALWRSKRKLQILSVRRGSSADARLECSLSVTAGCVGLRLPSGGRDTRRSRSCRHQLRMETPIPARRRRRRASSSGTGAGSSRAGPQARWRASAWASRHGGLLERFGGPAVAQPGPAGDPAQVRGDHRARRLAAGREPAATAAAEQQAAPSRQCTHAVMPPFRRTRCRVAWRLPPRKCHEIETDLGGTVVRQPLNAQVTQDQHVTRRGTLHGGGRPRQQRAAKHDF